MKVAIHGGCCLLMTVVACLSGAMPKVDTILIGDDGQIRGIARGNYCAWQLDFGLPKIKAVKSWSEGPILRNLWIINGIRYTQTVLGSSFQTNGETNAVLLVDIAGENTNSEYTEATAALAAELEGKRQSFELKDGLLWKTQNGHSDVVAALEIQATGINVATGETLRFRGSIPPSLKGSMTWKFPLQELTRSEAEALEDISFDEELQKALAGRTPHPNPELPRMAFEKGGHNAPRKSPAPYQQYFP